MKKTDAEINFKPAKRLECFIIARDGVYAVSQSGLAGGRLRGFDKRSPGITFPCFCQGNGRQTQNRIRRPGL